MDDKLIVLVLKGYPRLSETFIAQEIHSLEQKGFRIHIVSLRRPNHRKRHPVHEMIKAPVTYLPEYLYQEPMRVFRGWLSARRLPGYRKALKSFLKDAWRERTPNRFRRFGQALVLAAEFPEGGKLLYSHFIHTPSSVTRYAAEMLGIHWTASAHAKDIWTIPDWELKEKLDSLDWIVTCTSSGRDHLAELASDRSKVNLAYHGLDLERFSSSARVESIRDGITGGPVQILTVARAVEKKGLDTLIDALALLPPDLQWQWRHVGVGEDWEKIKHYAAERGIAEKVAFLGEMAQAEVIGEYMNADLFALPCRVASSGDRDGLPNVLVEAQNTGLMCVSTTVSGVPELIEDGRNGLLVPQNDAISLAAALEKAIRNPKMRAEMGRIGSEIVARDFEHEASIKPLVKLLQTSLDKA
ncbi:glycosyltransferase family 4 protein [Rhizobium sp. L1K21]|uniref:glycosyltransferase family 4 protein n=1 Tax=Rhizobium sp. L1K21 TaxID=2954933 RepID=UPI002093FC77|nr:glycosyltransferase family 4 protein [Rhizobium sp. L1K21]MCO6187644.1 glycosyltransferase family 4 protein [Rhizobium sp. L1K21]